MESESSCRTRRASCRRGSSLTLGESMKNRPVIFVALAVAMFAQDPRTKAPDSPVIMPEVKVHGPRFESFTFSPSQDRDGSFALRLKPGPRLPDMFTILVGGALPGDVVIGIKSANGSIEVKTLSRRTWSSAVDHGDLKLVVRRAVGRRAYRIVELDARRMPEQ
jgi:hypothetical protein